MTDREFLFHAFKGDADAVALAFMIARVSHVWDDLIDKDKPVADADVNEAFWLALVQIPANAFYRRFGEELRPVMASGILNWIAATDIERRKPSLEALQVAHVIRYSVSDVLVLMAALCGGASWAFEVAAELRLRCQKNGFLDYVKEHDR